MHRSIPAISLAMLLIANGCAHQNHAHNPPLGPKDDGLVIGLSVSQKGHALPGGVPTFPLGEPLSLTLTVTNTSTESRTLEFLDGRLDDFTIWKTEHGTLEMQVWTSKSVDLGSGTHVLSRTIPAGTAIEFAITWAQVDDQGLATGPGHYSVIGVLELNKDDHRSSRTIDFDIAEPSAAN